MLKIKAFPFLKGVLQLTQIKPQHFYSRYSFEKS